MARETKSSAGRTTVAAIDIGSNSIRMTVAQVAPDGGMEVLDRMQRTVHLGQDTFVTRRLSTPTMNAAISVLADFRQVLAAYQVQRIRAAATSAIREATNADTFLDRVYIACGLEVEVISTSEQSRLEVSAVREAMASSPDIGFHRALIAEVGGGSALLTVLRKGEIVSSESYGLGAVRLRESLSLRDEAPRKLADLIRHQITGILSAIKGSLPLKDLETFFAVGTEARFAARQVGRPTRSPLLHLVARRAFDELVRNCEAVTGEELGRRYGLSHAEAETLVPALLVFQALIHQTAARRIVVSQTSMRDGLLLDLAREVTGREDEELAKGVEQSARAIGEKYRCDAAHASHVAEMAVRLFDLLKAEHGLGWRERLLLRVAGILHEAGAFVSGRAHHKHSYYLIANAEVFGLNRQEQEIVALVARYHRRGLPQPTHPEYVAMDREKRVVVNKLAAILRVADALDRWHGQQVRDFHVERRADELVIHVHGVPDLTLERRAMPRKADLFEEIYGMTVRLEEAQEPAGGKR
jgi:exopolyphosphatase/guanosine-5'-triphosphate,3'-diphosphate pyrophosphatase